MNCRLLNYTISLIVFTVSSQTPYLIASYKAASAEAL